MSNFFLELDRLLATGQRLVVARIIRQKGSAPRSIGTKCIILETGAIQGTIGGGMLEYQVVEKALEVLKEGKSAILHFQLTGEDVAGTDMLCGGIVDVFLEPVLPENQTARDIFAATGTLTAQGKKQGTLLTLIAEGIEQDSPDSRALVRGDAVDIRLAGRIFSSTDSEMKGFLKVKSPELLKSKTAGGLVFVEPPQAADMLYIFGAGHISTFLSPLAKRVGFGVVVLDDREEFANKKRFPDADEIVVTPFCDSFQKIVITPDSYVAIITRGHKYDQTVLREALLRQSAYIGMVGSRRKREMIYQALMAEGTSPNTLEKVHSPIGLAIGAETPEEIAVSIVAELIQERDRLRKRQA